MKRNGMMAVVLIAVVLVVAGAGYWFSHRSSWAYQGMGAKFPEKTQVFMETSQLGQWMPPGEAKSAGAPAQASRGTDPMLQVLKTVWAAPAVTPKDLPELLRAKPMAAGFWLEGSKVQGAALIPLAPGEKAAVEQMLKEKMGDGPVAATVAGVALHKVEHDLGEGGLKLGFQADEILWGVSDAVAVVALGEGGAKAVLADQGKALSEDPVFLSALKRFPAAGSGATLFVRGSLLQQVAKAKSEEKETAAVTAPPPPVEEKKPDQGKAKASAKAAAPDPDEPTASTESDTSKALKALVKVGLPKLLAVDSIRSFALWTSPPKDGEKGWQVQSWLGFNEPPRGIWRLAAEGSSKTPQICGRLPRGGQVYVWGAGRDPARLYQDTLDELSKDLPAEQMSWVRAGIGAAEGKLNISFANDLLPTLSDEWCFTWDRQDAEGKGKEAASKAHAAFYITLRDSRRFEDLVNQKLATQLKLKAVDLKGARGWSFGVPGQEKTMQILVSGGMAILTDDPAWALDNGGNPGKAWKALSDYRGKACTLVFAEPGLWSDTNDILLSVSSSGGPQGIYSAGLFPGQPPGHMFGKKGCDKPCDKPCDGEKAASEEGSKKGTL